MADCYDVLQLKTLLPALGALQSVEVSVPWWRDQSYYDVAGRGTYARDGGGVLISQAIHTLDLMLAFTGQATRVTAFCARSSAHEMEAEDFVCAGLEFKNGAIGQVFASTASFPGRSESITLYYSQATAQLETGSLTIHWRDGRVQRFGAQAGSGAGSDPMAFSSRWHQTVIEDFADCVRFGKTPIASGRSALEVHRLIDAITVSGQLGKTIELDTIGREP